MTDEHLIEKMAEAMQNRLMVDNDMIWWPALARAALSVVREHDKQKRLPIFVPPGWQLVHGALVPLPSALPREGAAQAETGNVSGVVVDWLGGNCPVQAEGTFDSVPFYFRARGEHWSVGVGGDPVGNPAWEIEEEWGSWPDAGWMPEEAARSLIDSSFAKWRAARPSDDRSAPAAHREPTTPPSLLTPLEDLGGLTKDKRR